MSQKNGDTTVLKGSHIGIIAGSGRLPHILISAIKDRGLNPVAVHFPENTEVFAADTQIHAEFEKPGRMFAALKGAGVEQIVFAGAISRPNLNMRRFDWTLWSHAKRLLPALKGGDDGTLRAIKSIFTHHGFTILGAHEIIPDLLCDEGALTKCKPSKMDVSDITRAVEIVHCLGSVDVGQGAIVAQGICLGLETIQGTEAMLSFVANTTLHRRPNPSKGKGVFFKGTKSGQDRQMDLPAIGIDTIAQIAAAGLSGIAVHGGSVMILDKERVIEAADQAGVFIHALPAPQSAG